MSPVADATRPAPAARDDAPRAMLAGLRVVEVAGLVAGPYCGRILAALGADVVKVEPPGLGDPARRREPFLGGRTGPEDSALFFSLNCNKRGVTLDVGQPAGRALLGRLLERADVLIEDLAPDRKAEVGIDAASLGRLNRALVAVSITPFGVTGPWRNYRAYELQVFHAGGEGYLLPNGLALELFPERPPLKIGGLPAQYQAGLSAAAAVAAALIARSGDGLGQSIDLAQRDVQLVLSCMALQRYTDGVLEHRTTRSFRYGGVLPCADGYVALLTLEQRQWEGLVAMMDNPEWTRDERFRDPIRRAEHGAEINRKLRAWSRTHTVAEVLARARRHGVPVGQFHSPADVCESRHERERGFFQEVPHHELGFIRTPTFPFRFSATPAMLRKGAPRLGEHNRAVYQDELGLSAEELAKLVSAGVI